MSSDISLSNITVIGQVLEGPAQLGPEDDNLVLFLVGGPGIGQQLDTDSVALESTPAAEVKVRSRALGAAVLDTLTEGDNVLVIGTLHLTLPLYADEPLAHVVIEAQEIAQPLLALHNRGVQSELESTGLKQ